MTLIEKLKIEKKKWENKIYGVGETRIDLMIDDVIRELQTQQEEIEKKDTLINTMQAEFERLEDLEDNTDMLKLQLQKKDKIIDEMAGQLVRAHGWFYSQFDNYTKEDFKEYFINKVEKENKDE